jgi:hypothetical protein
MGKKMGRRMESWGPRGSKRRRRARTHVVMRATRALQLIFGLIVLFWLLLVVFNIVR